VTLPATPEDRRRLAEDIAAWEERAAIIEADSGLGREAAENAAAAQLGYRPAWRGSILKVIDTCGP
jgi:hypothetical protein